MAGGTAQQRPGLRFVVPAVPSLKPQIEAAALAAGVAQQVRIVAGQSHAVLAACDGNKSEAARRLGISRKTMDRKCQAWGVGDAP